MPSLFPKPKKDHHCFCDFLVALNPKSPIFFYIILNFLLTWSLVLPIICEILAKSVP